jgi:hypothetical protein
MYDIVLGKGSAVPTSLRGGPWHQKAYETLVTGTLLIRRKFAVCLHRIAADVTEVLVAFLIQGWYRDCHTLLQCIVQTWLVSRAHDRRWRVVYRRQGMCVLKLICNVFITECFLPFKQHAVKCSMNSTA